jgi:hypothetical protein
MLRSSVLLPVEALLRPGMLLLKAESGVEVEDSMTEGLM